MKERAILLIPKLSNLANVNQIRKDFDPLYQKVPPHITLVFPFKSSIGNDKLIKHIQMKLNQIKKIDFSLKEISFKKDGYIFWHVDVGKENITKLHDELYSDDLLYFLNSEIPYIPHITLGSDCSMKKIEMAQEKIKALCFDENCESYSIILEEIQEDGKSIVLKSFEIA